MRVQEVIIPDLQIMPRRLGVRVQTTREVAFPWEAEYFNGSDESIWGPPSEIYHSLIPLLPSDAKILDAGSGDGRHSLLLASNGFDVTAVDISTNAIEKLNSVALKRKIRINAVVEDILEYGLAENYDLIIAHGLLHLLSTLESRQLLKRFQKCTRPGGYNVVVVNTNKIPLPSYAYDYMIGLFDDAELADHYIGWDILTDERYEKSGSTMIPHSRHFNKIATRKR